jgi:hypothetical protein
MAIVLAMVHMHGAVEAADFNGLTAIWHSDPYRENSDESLPQFTPPPLEKCKRHLPAAIVRWRWAQLDQIEQQSHASDPLRPA